MKGLLHSKLFRKNLFKWLFMYITIIGLFTSVVTYSKYISSMQSADAAKVALFDVSITYDGICKDVAENQTCDIGNYRPTNQLSYYFTVDTTNLEVSTILVTNIQVLEYFNNIKIYDITETKKEMTSFRQNSNNLFTLEELINIDNTYVRKYEVTMDYNYEKYDNDHLESQSFNPAVTVGYSATQKK